MKYTSEEMSKKAIDTVVSLMVAAAETAPKGKGISSMESIVIDGEEKAQLVAKMKEMSKELNAPTFERDAKNIEVCPTVVMFAGLNTYRGIANCGFCGAGNCGNAKNIGAHCAFNVGDLGIAVGSAVALASDHRIDNRIMYTAGKAGLALGFFSEDAVLAYGIPLSVSEKSPFFDR